LLAIAGELFKGVEVACIPIRTGRQVGPVFERSDGTCFLDTSGRLLGKAFDVVEAKPNGWLHTVDAGFALCVPSTDELVNGPNFDVMAAGILYEG
jgi:hypothetical protein